MRFYPNDGTFVVERVDRPSELHGVFRLLADEKDMSIGRIVQMHKDDAMGGMFRELDLILFELSSSDAVTIGTKKLYLVKEFDIYGKFSDEDED